MVRELDDAGCNSWVIVKSSLTEVVVYPTLVRKAIPAAAQSPFEALVIILGRVTLQAQLV